MADLARPILTVPIHSGYLFELSIVELHSMTWKIQHSGSSDGLLMLQVVRLPAKDILKFLTTYRKKTDYLA